MGFGSVGKPGRHNHICPAATVLCLTTLSVLTYFYLLACLPVGPVLCMQSGGGNAWLRAIMKGRVCHILLLLVTPSRNFLASSCVAINVSLSQTERVSTLE